MKYLHLISGPRNISTALMYSFAQRSDTTVIDEPFYAIYLSKSGANHPGKDLVLNAQSTEENLVFDEIFREHDKPVLFIKNMAHHLEVINKKFLTDVTNIFLIRNPHQLIASYAEVIEAPVMRDIGIKYECELFFDLKKNGARPIVIDSGSVLDDPRAILAMICHETGIEFQDAMLHWEKGPKSYDGVWAPHWYDNVHRSTGFEKQATSSRELPLSLQPLYEEAYVYYEKLLSFALQP